ncbi:MAG: MarR family winged helix-turn-helix transcriptional regulator [Pseudomonadota bacterium]
MNSSTIPAPTYKPCTCLQLRKLTRTVSRLYDQHLAKAGLKTTQFSLLRHIIYQALPMAQLATLLCTERTTLTRNLRPLIDAGWVVLLPGSDPRQRIVTITDAGRDKARAAKTAWRTAQDEIEKLLGQDTIQALHTVIDFSLERLDGLDDDNKGDDDGA